MDLPEPDRSRLVAVNRTHLHLWEWGDPTNPPVICLHGAYDHGRMWDQLAPSLADQGFHVVAPDLRGHGDSGRISTGHLWLASALDIAELIRTLGGSAGLIGHSFGGGQALFVAAMWPELARWVIDIDGLGPPADALDLDAEGNDLAEASAAGFASLDRTLTQPPRVYPSRADAAERRRRINGRMPEPWIEHLTHHGTRQTEGGWSWKVDPMMSVGFPDSFDIDTLIEQYRLVECPTLVLTGTEPDTWSDLSEAEIAERVAAIGARHRSVPETGHYLHLEQPEVTLDALLAFIDEQHPVGVDRVAAEDRS